MQPTPEMEQRFSDWQRGLTLTDKRNQSAAEISRRQRELIDAVNGGSSSFAGYLREALRIDPGIEVDAPPLPRNVDPSELRDPPLQLEQDIHIGWLDHVQPRDASQPLQWTRRHLKWIEDGRFGERLHEAFLGTLSSGAPEKTMEAATRNLLRRLGGLPHVRGKVSVLNDCPLSRAWWRGRLAADAAVHCDGSFDAETAHRVLHSSNDAWARLVGDSVRRITVMNHDNVRAAVIDQYRNASRDGHAVPAREMQDAVRLLARHGPILTFGMLSWTDLTSLASEAVELARQDVEEPTVTDPEPANPADLPTTPTQQLTRFLRRLAN